jgi:hypothetical protein
MGRRCVYWRVWNNCYLRKLRDSLIFFFGQIILRTHTCYIVTHTSSSFVWSTSSCIIISKLWNKYYSVLNFFFFFLLFATKNFTNLTFGFVVSVHMSVCSVTTCEHLNRFLWHLIPVNSTKIYPQDFHFWLKSDKSDLQFVWWPECIPRV